MKHNILTKTCILFACCGPMVLSSFAQDRLQRRDGLRESARQRADEIRTEVDSVASSVDVPAGSTELDSSANIAANTVALIELDEALDSSKHGQGHRFTGTLQSDILSGESVIAKRGSTVQGKVVSARQPRRVAGQSYVELKLTGIMVGDQMRSIESSMVRVESGRTGADTLRKTATAAAVGGLADGSKGGEMGAKIGAGASLLSKGQTAAVAGGNSLEFLIGEPGSEIASQSSETLKQTQESGADRIRDRRDSRTGRRR